MSDDDYTRCHWYRLGYCTMRLHMTVVLSNTEFRYGTCDGHQCELFDYTEHDEDPTRSTPVA